ncbi:hypothetical protein [Undibacterium curvum]|uniref:hypothetical protein n=1 Tax=Undibacterium curvum TaxID=2762294 RepID=UPI003D150395
MQIRFTVEVLPRKAQIKNKVIGVACLLRVLVRQGFSEGSTVLAPDRVAVTIRDHPGGVEMIGVDIKHFCYVADDRWVVIDDVNDQGRAGAGIACAVGGFGGPDCVRINLSDESNTLRRNPELFMTQ